MVSVSSGVSGNCWQYGSQAIPQGAAEASPSVRLAESNVLIVLPSTAHAPQVPPEQTLSPYEQVVCVPSWAASVPHWLRAFSVLQGQPGDG